MMISIAVRQYGVQPPNQPMQRTGRADAPRRPIEEGSVPNLVIISWLAVIFGDDEAECGISRYYKRL